MSILRNGRHQLCRLTLFGLALLLVFGPTRADSMQALANEAMRLSGARAILTGAQGMLEKQLASDQRIADLKPRERAQLIAAMKHVVDGTRMADELTALLVKTGDSARLATAVKTMRDPLFQKVTQDMTVDALNTTDQQVLGYVKTLEKTPPDPIRVALLQQLDAATDGARVLADTRYESIEAMLGDKGSATDRAELVAMRPQIEASAQNEFIVRNLHLTRNLDIPTLEAYVKLHQGEAMGWLARQLGYGIQRAMVKSAADLMQKLTLLMPPPTPERASASSSPKPR